ncbi:hypothetical protein [Umezakia ovalisporum]|jgi:hypothetical protein|uniref:Uncharacterized protein n=2 Tax=Umezakia ovalisporum TaxID=75695 RepID=A0AA43H118_9CYAN|nr:hypothetical protein [Umezakia ovalisporum]MBI1241265.1 hypothetical protein [Nostoc sp. RI_552]MDH6055633.1 hypothetical protein [Umezakia ovalisporum FSS-43]MDH6064758.1 hypothetical protein [Umezakia ovalisporum FSS-62]MDH6066454.1 hypothetical protein [Umezakia ovalisporum APH033B]MDH6071315.1 hypothetical protein [Umezakia ovalisporum CobakiLakeA]
MNAGKNVLQDTQDQTRLLLALWGLGGAKQEVKKGQLTKRVISKGKKVADYKHIFEELEKQGAITISKTGYFLTSPKGLEVLGEGLRSGDFQFEGTIVGTWVANALLQWISQIDPRVGISGPVNLVKGVNITSYEDFKAVVLAVYDKLNQDYNLDDLVPIYRIRRKIGEQVSRESFNTWLIEMQADDILQLITGEIPDFTFDKREDSISIAGTQLRSYAKRLI